MREDPYPFLGVVGAGGLVGRELLGLLAARGHPAVRLRAWERPNRAPRELPYGPTTVRSRPFRSEELREVEGVVFAAGADAARAYARRAAARAFVVDTSSAWRGDPEVPVVVPEVNGAALTPAARLVASPNCTAVLLALALEPLRRRFGLAAVTVATYQPAAGAGHAGLEALAAESRRAPAHTPPPAGPFPHPCAFNVFSHESAVDPTTGWNREEAEVAADTARLWGEEVPVTPTCLRVPVFRGHVQVVTAGLRAPADGEAVRRAFAAAPWIELREDPTARAAEERWAVLVGRIRTFGPRRVGFVAAADTLRRCTAGNVLALLDARLPTGG